MNQEIKQQWIDALRSGEYEQGQNWLKQITENGYSFCCLGVLCDLYSQDVDVDWEVDEEGEIYMNNSSETLPKSVAKWAGIEIIDNDDTYSNGYISVRGLNGAMTTLVNLNDSGRSFSEIAGIIEKEL